MFCTKCGKELLDEAVVCTGCGCLVQDTEQATPSKRKTDKVGNVDENRLTGFFIATFVCVSLAIMFVGIAIVSSLQDGMYVTSGFGYTTALWYLNGVTIPAFICAVVALGTAIPAFIFARKGDYATKMIATFALILSSAIFLLNLFCFISYVA